MSTHLWQGKWQGRSPAGDLHQRARKVISPSGGIMRGKFSSHKNGRMVHHEGLLELDAIYLFETSPRIVRYREQPTTIFYPDGARLRRYTPDFELLLTTGELVLIEVKPLNRRRDPEVQHKLGCISTQLERSSQQFVVLSEDVLRLEPRQANLREAYHRVPRVPISPGAMRAVIDRYGRFFPMTFGDACSLLARSGVDPYSLLLSGWVRCPLDTPINTGTILSLVEEDSDAWFCIAHQHGF